MPRKDGSGFDWLVPPQLHQRTRSEASHSDEYETPHTLYEDICNHFRIYPELDVCAEYGMNKCFKFFSPAEDGLAHNWKHWSVWCNPPHSKTKEFALHADKQWTENNINIMMLVPANAVCAHYFSDIFNKKHATYHRVAGRIRFLVDGKPSPHPSRNAYFVVVWRKRNG